jgi:hypothetical protein
MSVLHPLPVCVTVTTTQVIVFYPDPTYPAASGLLAALQKLLPWQNCSRPVVQTVLQLLQSSDWGSALRPKVPEQYTLEVIHDSGTHPNVS